MSKPVRPTGEDLDDLNRAISEHCKWQRLRWNPQRSPVGAYTAANRLRQVLRRAFPGLPGEYDEYPVDNLATITLYANRIVELGVTRLSNEATTLLWKEYFLAGTSVSDTANAMRYSTRTVHRRIVAFPQMVSEQLWEMNLKLVAPQQATIAMPTITHAQRQAQILRAEFGLSDRQLDVLLAFMRPGERIGRRAIAKELGLSENTLKTHIRHIIQKMGVNRMDRAADKAKVALRRSSILTRGRRKR